MTETVHTHRRFSEVPRTRGMLSGIGLVLLGAWGAVIPFVGPYFHYAYAPDTTWTWSSGRFVLEVLPGVVAFVAGLILLVTASRIVAVAASWLAIAAGAWFVIGPLVAPLWNANYIGSPVGSTRDIAVEQIGMFFGLGAAIILCGAVSLGRFSVADTVVESASAPAAQRAVDPRTEAVPTTGVGPTGVAPTTGVAPSTDPGPMNETEAAAVPADGGPRRRGSWRRGHFLPS
jgi:hypothetical protein